MKSTIPDEPVLESIVLCLMNHYIKRIPVDRNHIDVKLYGVHDQIELTDGKFVFMMKKTITTILICIPERKAARRFSIR